MRKWVVRGLLLMGCIYAIALIPPSIRPTWEKAPFAKPEATITQPVGTPNYQSRLQNACRAPWILRPIMGSADKVRVVLTDNVGNPVSISEVNCAPYVA